MKIKTQRWSPDTCFGGNDRCEILILWDADAPVEEREHRIAGFERVCAAHADNVPSDVLLWWDGNYKPMQQYLEYQRAWYRHLNHVEWLEKHPDQPVPVSIRSFNEEPRTTGSVSAPPQAQRDALTRAYGRNTRDNALKNQAITIPGATRTGLDPARITWRFEGVGDERVLTVDTGGQLNQQQRGQGQSIANVQFGAGKVVLQ